MVWLTLTLLAVAVYGFYRYLHQRCVYFEKLGLPYFPGLPLLGNMAGVLLGRQHITRLVEDIYNYAPGAKYLGAFDFMRPVIVVRDLELIKDITIKHADSFLDHHIMMDESVDPVFGGGLLQLTGDRWRVTRNLLSPAFTSSKMKTMQGLMTKCAENFVEHLTELSESEPNNVIAIRDYFARYANDVVASCILGVEVDSFQEPDNQLYLMGCQATSFEGLRLVKFLLIRAFPGIAKKLGLKIVRDEEASFFMNVVGRIVATRDGQEVSRPDIIQLMMDARGKASSNARLDLTGMTAQAFDYYFAGFDITTTQLCIISHALTIHPEIQIKLQAEIDSILAKTNGKPSCEDINSMAYLDAVFNETMRCYAQFDSLDRVCTKAFELPPALPGGRPFVVQPGMDIWVPISAIHKDERYYENPSSFDPERYLNKKVTINDVENLGFGIGPRACTGKRFAIAEIKILFFYVLAKFSLRPNEKTCKSFEYDTTSVSVVPKGGYWLTVERRK